MLTCRKYEHEIFLKKNHEELNNFIFDLVLNLPFENL